MNKRLKLSAHQMFFFMSTVAFSFNVILMQSKGFSNTTIGIILAINAIVSIVMQPVWGFVCDWIQSVRKVFVFCTILTCISYCSLAFFSSVTAFTIIFPISTIFSCVLITLVNAACLVGIEQTNITFGSVRIWGSIGYAGMSFLIGHLLRLNYSINIIFPVYAIFAVASITLSFFIEDTAPRAKASSFKDMNLGVLFKNYHFITCMACICICYIPISATFSYAVNVFEALGGSKGIAGTIFAMRALAEVPFFIVSAPLIRRFGARNILIFSLFIFAGSILTFGFATNINVALVANVLEGPAYGLLLPSAIYYIYDLSPLNLRTTAQTVLTTVQKGVGSMVGNFVAGLLIDLSGPAAAFRFLSIIMLAGIVFFLLSLYFGKKKNISAGGMEAE